MKALIQRVSEAQVKVNGEITGKIGSGILALVGFGPGDEESKIVPLRDKILNLRIFPNDEGKFDKSLVDIRGGLLLVSQFTLYGNCDKGRRPDFTKALHPKEAEPLYDKFVKASREVHEQVETGIFGAMMNVTLVNDGPVTLMIEV